MRCPHCGAQVPDEDRFCGECGRPVERAELPGPPATVPPPKKKRAIWLWIVVGLLLAGIALCAALGGGTVIVALLWPTPTFTPTATPTLTPTPTVTPTPIPTATFTPTPTPIPQPKIKSMTFAPQVDDSGNPVGTTNTFPPGTNQVYCVFEYEGFAGIAEYRAVFSLDGEDDVSGTLEHDGSDSGQAWVRRYDDDGLAPGEYTIEIYVRDTLLSRSTFVVGGASPSVEESFDDANSGWTTQDRDISKIWYESGELHILVKEGGWAPYSAFGGQPRYVFSDYSMEVDAHVVVLPDKGAEYGIVARRDDNDYYQFVVTASGYYGVWKSVGGEWTTLVDWFKSDVIKQGANVVNRLGVDCRGSVMRFYANGTLLVEVEDDSFPNGQVGLVAGSFKDGGGVHIAFDNVVVYEVE